ncbi:hypothetical protein B0T18DRAFT_384891 [Schizothecium vesticola]|uniref:Uncharacterized protein n=1 Tax=Schizothecium vesticola TaxID=314040 RepID=A0AA40F7K1_9PEZI|nr:hypothetical protein B0T18DRAFT_384891 [Schizothecium vesticola]
MSPPACIFTPPYTGPQPPGLTKASDLAFWTAFIKSDNGIPNPAGADEFLFYSGVDGLRDCLGSIRKYISQYYFRTVAPWTRIFNLFKALTAGSDDPVATVRSLFNSYLADRRDGDTVSLHIKCMSWSLARRAAIHGGTVHLALWKGAPLLVKNSFWGEYGAGIITGPDSKVERIVRYDVERVPNQNGEENSGAVAIDPGVVVWERKKHKMLGIPFEHQDWIWGRRGTTIQRKSFGARRRWQTARALAEWSKEAGRRLPFKAFSSASGRWASPRRNR